MDYWADTGATSPLQHYWSLGVEEQFYLFWPALLATAAIIAVRVRLRPLTVIAVALTAVLLASLAWGYAQTDSQPMMAYFSSLTRAWELALGALIAVAAPLLAQMRDRWRAPIAWAGIAVLVIALLTTGEGSMPVPGALPATIATAAIIIAGTGSRPPELWPLTNRVAVKVGDWSFSLYLWHLPVIVFLGAIVTVHQRKFLVSTSVEN